MVRIEIYEAENGEYGWRAEDGNNRIVAVGGETYVRKADAVRGFKNVLEELRAWVPENDDNG